MLMRKTPSSPAATVCVPPFELVTVTRMRVAGRRPVGLMMCPWIERVPPAAPPPVFPPLCAPMPCADAPVCKAKSSAAAKSKRGSAEGGAKF